MKKILVFVICFLFAVPGYSDHYKDNSKKEKFDDLKNAIVLITTEISQDVRQPDSNPFDKFLNPNDKDDGTAPEKKTPVDPDVVKPEKSKHEVDDETPSVPSGMGTGFFIDEYHIVTNYHVVKERNGKADIKVLSLIHI